MFHQLFSCPVAIAAYRSAPLAKERRSYLSHCANNGYQRKTLRSIAADQLHLVSAIDLQTDGYVSLGQIETAAKEWARPGPQRGDRVASIKAVKGFVGHVIGWLRFIDRYKEPGKFRHSHVAEVAAFLQWMRQERGLSEKSVANRYWVLNPFFDCLDERDITLASINSADVDQVLVQYQLSGQYSRATVSCYAQVIRMFLRFAEQQGWCKAGIADGIIPPRLLPEQPVPKGLSRQEVLALLATTEGERPVERRDRAILMLLITYGFRAGEVCTLQLDDLNWKESVVRVRYSKLGRTGCYPLSRSVGETIVRYLCEVRPKCSQRALFLTLKAPVRPLGVGAVGAMVRRRMEKAGISGQYCGSHALRHSVAQHLLDQGLSMKQVGDYLGHRSVNATSVYAKVRLNALREVTEVSLEGLQ